MGILCPTSLPSVAGHSLIRGWTPPERGRREKLKGPPIDCASFSFVLVLLRSGPNQTEQQKQHKSI